MKARNRPLIAFLLQQGVLNGTAEAVAKARVEYRKTYKRNWRRQAGPKKEIRFKVTIKQFAAIRSRADAKGLKTATYVRSLALCGIGEPVMPGELLSVLQLVSMALIATSGEARAARAHRMLTEAESRLLKYLKK